MNASGFGAFVPFGEIPPGTLFLDHSLGGAGDTAILLKVGRGESRHNFVRLFDRAAAGRGVQMPALGSALLTDDRAIVALPDYFIEVENSVDNIVWESDAGFVKAAMCADSDGALLLKAFRNRNRDDCECDLFDLATGIEATLDRASVGFRRWSVVRRDAYGNREELYRFEL
ncbi:MAG: hypothetical protein WCO00_14145 [Rhodospirillaceae bacterium]